MLTRMETLFRCLRIRFSSSQWLTRLLRLPVSTGSPTRPGLLLIQIDGLSRLHLEQSLQRRQLPFLRRLLRREHYCLHDQYSGLPAATPAAQAELFYGVKTAVPAFAFRDSETDRIIRMYEPDSAERIEKMLREQGGEPLLRGGSVYADNFTGGAEEAHFCPAACSLPGQSPGRRIDPAAMNERLPLQ